MPINNFDVDLSLDGQVGCDEAWAPIQWHRACFRRLGSLRRPDHDRRAARLTRNGPHLCLDWSLGRMRLA